MRSAPIRYGLLIASLLASPAAAETLLHFAETAELRVPPDELAATLEAQASAATPADAQARVNAAIAAALAAAHGVASVTASTGAYRVWHQSPEHVGTWQAAQGMDLRSADGASLLRLIGALQQQGLGVTQLEWRLSEQAERTVQAAARRQALQALRARAEDAATALDMRFVEFRDIRLDLAPSAGPRFAVPFARAAVGAAAPSAESEPIAVTATVEAEALLQPR